MKLNPDQAKDVAKAEPSGSFLLEPGRYAAQLKTVEQIQGTKAPLWVWVFQNLHDDTGVRQAGRIWHNTSLSAQAVGFLKAVFDAFGAETTTDTDELEGEWVVLYLDQEEIEKGPKIGQQRNTVTKLARFKADDWPFDPTDFQPKKVAQDTF